MTAFYIFLGILAALSGIWFLVPILYGVPWRGTQSTRIRRALQLAEFVPGETFYDLGAGDGRALILAAKEFGARGVGIEAGILQVILAGWRARFSGVSSRVRMKRGDFYLADLGEADVVFAYLTSDQGERLRKLLTSQLREGARVVTVAFEIPDWQPAAFDREHLIFLYRMPPQQGSLDSFLELQG